MISQQEPHGITVLFNNAGAFPITIYLLHLHIHSLNCRTGIGRGGVKPLANKATATAEDFIKNYFDPIAQEDFVDSLNVNAVGPYWLTFAFLPLLEKWKNSEGGKKFVPQVVMTSSMNGWTKVRFPGHEMMDIVSLRTFDVRRKGSGNRRKFVPVYIFQVCNRTCHIHFGA